ncbi:MAG: AAA family ATPase [Opitutaceae bacterium]|jgi:ABC-type molybdenum transport system ATPase subunit/photorepair protein PhrA|nr:AAA family ATPase [Opitutaceae bacterium]
MLNQISIKNYKCFKDFTFSFDADGHSLLLLGDNGAGKTSLADALEIFQKIGRGDGRVGRLVSPAQRWDGGMPVEFKLAVTLDGIQYEYGFSAELPENFQELRILSEELKCGELVAYSRNGANISFGSHKERGDFSYDWHVLFLPTFQNAPLSTLQKRVVVFRDWLANILILSPEPKHIKAEVAGSLNWPERNGGNCVAWLNHVILARPQSYGAVEKYLKGLWKDFMTIVHEQVGSQNKLLRLEFEDNAAKHRKKFSPPLDLLSDGEKCLFLSAVVVAAHEVVPSQLCFLDEPDNFLSISEVGHFIGALRQAFSTQGQLIVSSHNPEVVNAFTESSTWKIGRGSHLWPTEPPKRISELRGEGSDAVLGKKASLVHALIAGEVL